MTKSISLKHDHIIQYALRKQDNSVYNIPTENEDILETFTKQKKTVIFVKMLKKFKT